MSGFGDFDTAMKARDTLTRLMINVLDHERPPYRYGTVISINPDGRSCTVRFPGGAADGSNDVTVRIGAIQPRGVGTTVRVAGYSGDRFISDVMGNAVLTTTTEVDLPVPTSVVLSQTAHQVALDWDDMSTQDTPVNSYEVEFAESADFLTNPVSYTTTSSLFQRGYDPGTTVYARVRSLNGVGGSSAWANSLPVSVVVSDYPAGSGVATDGNPPAGLGPAPIITEGLGFLYAQWVPMVNADPLVYEVHVSTVSGFTPDSTTYLGETSSTTYFVDTTPDNNKLVYGVTYFIKILPKDADGPGVAGPQGSGVPQQVELGDVGNVPTSAISDGVAPASSPNAPTVKAGIGFLFASWAHPANADLLTYEVHIGTSSGFIPDANSYVMQTNSDFAIIRTLGAGAAYAPLAYGTTYYVKIWAKDQDGYAPNAGTGTAGVPVQANTADIAVGAITAASAIIADAAIGTLKLQDGAITTAKIGDLQVNTAKIADLAITSAKVNDLSADKITAGNLLVSIQLTAGAIQTAATGARITLDNSGLKAYNSLGNPTVQINSDGTASFTGVVTATSGSIGGWSIGPTTLTGNSTSTILGGTIRTGPSGQAAVVLGNQLYGSPNSVFFFDNVWTENNSSVRRISSYSANDFAGRSSIAISLESGIPTDSAQTSASSASIVLVGSRYEDGNQEIRYGGSGSQTWGAHHTFLGPVVMSPASWVTGSGLTINATTAPHLRLVNSTNATGAIADTSYKTGSGWETRFGTIQSQWWHAGMDGGGSVRWGYDGTNFNIVSGGLLIANGGAAIYANSTGLATYGSLYVGGSRNGWAGITFNDAASNQTLMMSNTDFGVYDAGSGSWRLHWNGNGSGSGGGWNYVQKFTVAQTGNQDFLGLYSTDGGYVQIGLGRSVGTDDITIAEQSGGGQYFTGGAAGDLAIRVAPTGQIKLGTATSGTSYTAFYYAANPCLGNAVQNIAFSWAAATQVNVNNFANTAFAQIRAANVALSSTLESKHSIEPLEEGWAISVIKKAPSYKWKYVPADFAKHVNDPKRGLIRAADEPDEPWHFGPMWEEVHSDVRANDEGLDLRDLVGVEWAAISELDTRLARLEKMLAKSN